MAKRRISKQERVKDGLDAFHTTAFTNKIEGLTFFPPEKPKNFWFPIIAEIVSNKVTPQFNEVLKMYDSKKEQKMKGAEYKKRMKKYINSVSPGHGDHSNGVLKSSNSDIQINKSSVQLKGGSTLRVNSVITRNRINQKKESGMCLSNPEASSPEGSRL